MSELSHVDEATGDVRMVDVGAKPISRRRAVAHARVRMAASTAARLRSLPKGDALTVARVAGIQAAKRTSELIPLCHPLPVESVEVHFDIPELEPSSDEPVRLHVKAIARINAKTGVEMEALTAVSVAALTVYDMCKAIDKTMVIEGIRLVKKTGGTKSNLPTA